MRARLVSCELNKDGRHDAFSASTPPLEGKKILFSKFASEQKRGNTHIQLSFVDIKKAYFNAIPTREIDMSLPKEMGLPPGTLAKQVRCVYGTRDAGKLWEDAYTLVLENAGFVSGASNPCIFFHAEKDISIVVHGDDFTAMGTDADLTWYENQLKLSFEVKLRGRLGHGCAGPQQLRILNRIITYTHQGLTYEADPRHTDILLSSLNLIGGSAAATPGVKPTDRDEHALKSDEGEPSLDYSHPNASIAAICAVTGSTECADLSYCQCMNRDNCSHRRPSKCHGCPNFVNSSQIKNTVFQ